MAMDMMTGEYNDSLRGRHLPAQRSSRSTSRTMSRNVKRLQESVNLHLNNYEKELFLDALNQFHSEKDTWSFVELLRTILNTPAKQQLVPMIRQVLPAADVTEFDKCIQLSAAMARGDHGADRLVGSATPILSSHGRRPRSTSRKHNTAPVRLKPRAQSSERPTRGYEKGRVSIIQLTPELGGLGFSVQSADSNEPGVFVAEVDPTSDAGTQGLMDGDEILEANHIDLSMTDSHDAAVILQAARSLTLTVKHNQRSNGSLTRQESYTWVDTNGRSCSPPSSDVDIHGTMRSSVSKRSGMTLITSQDDRKINLRIEKGCGLGLTIRGGSDYGLGIYVTGVDRGSAAERCGIRVGDQVLAVNDVQFVDISHREAVQALKKSRHMMLTLKHVGKLPHARIDQMKTRRARSASGRRSRSQSRRSHSSSTEDLRQGMRYPGSLDRRAQKESVFRKAAGSQLMLSHQTVSVATQSLVDDQARNLLNDTERGTLKFYLDEYSKSFISIDALVTALSELFNTHAKFQLFKEIRPLLQPADLNRYDKLVVKYEVHSLKTRLDHRQEEMSDFSLDSVLSVHSNGSANQTYPHISPANQSSSHNYQPPIVHGSVRENGRSKKMFVTDGSNQTLVTDTHTPSTEHKRSTNPTDHVNSFSSPEDSPRDGGKNVPRMGMRAAKISSKLDGRSPSDDSGVDVRAKGGISSQFVNNNTDSLSRQETSAHQTSTHSASPRGRPASQQDGHMHSYSLTAQAWSGSEDTEDDHIPGLHSDLDATDDGNVVLVKSRHVGTLPRRRDEHADGPAHHLTSPSATFREQVKNRSALSGKIYLPPPASQRHELPLDDSDYETDILKISKELMMSAVEEPQMDSPPQRKDSFNIRDILPPPPAQLLQDSSSSASSLAGDTLSFSQEKTTPNEDPPLPADADDESSPKAERNSSKLDEKRTSSDSLYAVVKPKTKTTRPSLAALNSDDNHSSDSERTTPDMNTNQQQNDVPEERVVMVNKLKPTLGLAIEGGAGTKQPVPRIINIQDTGCAFGSGLKVGDVILRINDRYMEGLTHNQAARAIADAFRDRKTSYLDFLVSS